MGSAWMCSHQQEWDYGCVDKTMSLWVGRTTIFLFKAILYILINNENASGKHFVSLSQEILPFEHEGSSLASSDFSHLTHICHPKHCLKAHMVTMMGKAKDKSCVQILRNPMKEIHEREAVVAALLMMHLENFRETADNEKWSALISSSEAKEAAQEVGLAQPALIHHTTHSLLLSQSLLLVLSCHV